MVYDGLWRLTMVSLLMVFDGYMISFWRSWAANAVRFLAETERFSGSRTVACVAVCTAVSAGRLINDA